MFGRLSFFTKFKIHQSIKRPINYMKRRGIDILRDPICNKDSSFSLAERQLLGIHGLLPPAVNTLEEQAGRAMINLKKLDNDLDRYIFLVAMQDRNETLFYKVVTDNVEYCMPLIYTPTVGLACQKFGLLFRRSRGLYITIHDKKFIRRILNNWPHNNVKAIVVTDGERILGLGDLGAYGMGIPIGKLALYTALAGVPPNYTLPIMLDVGTDNHELLDDSMYLGVRHKRIRGSEYDEFFEAFMNAVIDKYGRSILIQFEDFGNTNAYSILNKYKEKYCCFNDDIQGTASVSLAALIGAGKLSKRDLVNNIFLFQGAGSAATGIATLLIQKMVMDGLSESEALSKIFMFDINGLLTKSRPQDTFTVENERFAKDVEHKKCLEESVGAVKPTVLIGVAGVPNVFTPAILQKMAENIDIPYIFALSNPTSKAECTAIDAYTNTKGRCIFASGSPFDPFAMDNRVLTPSQCNNSYIFPGIALAIVIFQIRPITYDLFIKAAETLASMVSEKELSMGQIFPPLEAIRNVSLHIAVDVAELAYKRKIANRFPEPNDKLEYIKKYLFIPQYHSSLPKLKNELA